MFGHAQKMASSTSGAERVKEVVAEGRVCRGRPETFDEYVGL